MQNEILAEIKELRTALTLVLGVSELPPNQQFLKRPSIRQLKNLKN